MTSLSTQPRSIYLDGIAQLLAWSPESQAFDAFNIARVPLRLRSAPVGARVHDCNDFNGGYVNPGDLYPQGVETIDTYNFSFWQYLDNFCYFSHHRIGIPTSWWVNAGHLHGVPMLGVIDFEGDSADDMNQMLRNKDVCISQLTALAQHYGFDGWFFNVEINLSGPEQGKALLDFVQDLRTALHEVDPNSLAIWYDAVLPSGWLSYQNCLNQQNNPFFQNSDGIFPNYWWYGNAEQMIGTSVATAQDDQRSPFDVYTGVDVYARGTGYQQANTSSGNDAIAALGDCVKYGTSAGLFAPGWTFGNASGTTPSQHHQNFELLDAGFWSGNAAGYNPGPSKKLDCVAQYIPERAIGGGLPFATNFDRGCGINLSVRGTIVSPAQWSNLALQGAQPTYRFWALPGSANSFSVGISYGNGYDGGACLAIQGSGAAGDTVKYRLYDINAPVPGALSLQVIFKPLTADNFPAVHLELAFTDGTTYLTSSASVALNGWLAVSETMSANTGKTISEIRLCVGPSVSKPPPVAGSYGVLIGEISIASSGMAGPASVQNLCAQAVNASSTAIGAWLSWDCPNDAARYFDVWRVDGAAARWLMRVCANTVWIGNLAGLHAGLSCTFKIQPVDYALNAQPLNSAASVSLNVEPMTFDDGPTAALLGNPAITSATVMAGDILNAIQMNNGSYPMPQHGDTSGSVSTITLEGGDQIVAVSGFTGTWYGWDCVVQLSLKTRSGKTYGPYGKMSGVTSSMPFSHEAPSGKSLLAFSGSLVTVPLAGGSMVKIIRSLAPLFG